MQTKGPRNYSGLFNLFAYDKPDRTGHILQKIGKISFTIAFAGSASTILFKNDSSSPLYDTLIAIWGISWALGLLMFIATGIHYSGRAKGKTNFLASAAYMLRNTFLYLFLPALAVTALVITWAIITKQPVFR